MEPNAYQIEADFYRFRANCLLVQLGMEIANHDTKYISNIKNPIEKMHEINQALIVCLDACGIFRFDYHLQIEIHFHG